MGRGEEIGIPAGLDHLAGVLVVPPGARGLVVFVHDVGSSRFSPRNRFVAERLGEEGIATLQVDLRTEREETGDADAGWDPRAQAARLVAVIDWAEENPDLSGLRVGLFAVGSGLGPALQAARNRPRRIVALVARSGRREPTGGEAGAVAVPTLLVVGGDDPTLVESNRRLAGEIGPNARVEVVAGAGPLFEDPGAAEQVADLASHWFGSHLGAVLEDVPPAGR